MIPNIGLTVDRYITARSKRVMRLNLATVLVVCGLSAPLLASAACQHYHRSELRAMTSDDLESAYCDEGLEAKKAAIQDDGAKKLEDVNRSRASLNIYESIRSYHAADDAESAIAKCGHEMDRISRILVQRQADMEKINHDCGLDGLASD